MDLSVNMPVLAEAFFSVVVLRSGAKRTSGHENTKVRTSTKKEFCQNEFCHANSHVNFKFVVQYSNDSNQLQTVAQVMNLLCC